MECSDGSGISSRVYNGLEDGVMGSLAARRVAEGDWAGVWEAVIVDLFPSSPAFVAQGPKTAETPANTRHVGVAWIPL